MRVFEQTGDLKAVVRHIVAETKGTVTEPKQASARAVNELLQDSGRKIPQEQKHEKSGTAVRQRVRVSSGVSGARE